MTKWKNQVRRAIKIAGSQARLAKKAGLSQQAISKMLSNGAKKISPESAIALETATDGKVSRHDFRPDIFGVPMQVACQKHVGAK